MIYAHGAFSIIQNSFKKNNTTHNTISTNSVTIIIFIINIKNGT